MGWGRATVIAENQTLVVERDGQRRHMNISDSAALERELGWNMPAALLPYWIRGIPAPGVKIGQRAVAQGRLTTLQQSGWSLTYESYQQVDHLILPAKITFEGESASGKIIIKQWTLGETRS